MVKHSTDAYETTLLLIVYIAIIYLSLQNYIQCTQTLFMDANDSQEYKNSWTIDRLAKEHGVDFRLVYYLSIRFRINSHVIYIPFIIWIRRNLLGSGSIRGTLDVKNLALMIRNADYAVRVRSTCRFRHIQWRNSDFIWVGRFQRNGPALSDTSSFCYCLS